MYYMQFGTDILCMTTYKSKHGFISVSSTKCDVFAEKRVILQHKIYTRFNSQSGQHKLTQVKASIMWRDDTVRLYPTHTIRSNKHRLLAVCLHSSFLQEWMSTLLLKTALASSQKCIPIQQAASFVQCILCCCRPGQ